jgi:hypothetical protein
VQSFKFIVDGPVPNAREYAPLFDVSTEQLKLAEVAILQALDWRVRCPTVCDYLHVLVERERFAGLLPCHILQQIQQVAIAVWRFIVSFWFSFSISSNFFPLQHSEQYCIKFFQFSGCCRFLPSETAAAAWRESLCLWNVQGGRSADIAAALAARRGVRTSVLTAAMAAAKVR